MNDFKELIRGSTRPVVTVMNMFAIMWCVIEKIDVPQWFIALSMTIIIFWFGERAIQNIRNK